MAQYLFISICFMASLLIVFSRIGKLKSLVLVLFVGWSFRFLLLWADYYGLFVLPGSGADSAAFIRHSRFLADLPWHEMLDLYNPTHAFNGYAWYGALIMRWVGYHELILPALNLVAGSVGLVFCCLIVQEMWGDKAARISSWILALYPFAAFNSAIGLREELVITSFVIGLFYLLRWATNQSFFGIFIAVLFFGFATSIHPGFVGAFVGIALFMGVKSFRSVTVLIRGKGVSFKEFANTAGSIMGLASLLVVITIGGGLALGKGITVGGEDGTEALVDSVESRFQRDAKGGSAYPAFLATGDPFSQPWLIPARMIYFHFSPFPWDIRSPRHILGLVSSFLYLFLFYKIYRGWPELKKRPENELMLFMLLGLTFVFAIGVTNIGTAIRHKTKFLALILIMAASSFSSIRTKFRN